jgi:hypothetical protein
MILLKKVISLTISLSTESDLATMLLYTAQYNYIHVLFSKVWCYLSIIYQNIDLKFVIGKAA